MELRPNRFNSIAPVTKNLLIINCLVFLAQYVLGQSFAEGLMTEAETPFLRNVVADYGALHHWKSPNFKIWQFLTSMFMHFDFTHIFFNMFMLWMFGNIIERRLGSKRFLWFYLLCGFGAAIFYLAINTITHDYFSSAVGASGAVYGIIFAFSWLHPESELLLFFVLPVKAKWLILGTIVFSIYFGLQQIAGAGGGIAHFAHLGGMVAAFVIFKSWKIRYGG